VMLTTIPRPAKYTQQPGLLAPNVRTPREDGQRPQTQRFALCMRLRLHTQPLQTSGHVLSMPYKLAWVGSN